MHIPFGLGVSPVNMDLIFLQLAHCDDTPESKSGKSKIIFSKYCSGKSRQVDLIFLQPCPGFFGKS